MNKWLIVVIMASLLLVGCSSKTTVQQDTTIQENFSGDVQSSEQLQAELYAGDDYSSDEMDVYDEELKNY